jgi:2-amino-4-hydroxy-6-hydroxymethyldihydropteridine diphosphokinase
VRIYKYYIGLGSNIEPRLKYLQAAVDLLSEVGDVTVKSSIYESQPWGNTNQAHFYNAVVLFATKCTPTDLLSKIKSIEYSLGRSNHAKWAPRQVDIDILTYDAENIMRPELSIPHRYLTERKFVLEPLSEVTDVIHLDNRPRNLTQLILDCPDNGLVQKLNIDW